MKKIISKVEILSEEEILQIHNTACNILKKTGMLLPDKTFLKRCRQAGARIDETNEIVYIPKSCIEELIIRMKKEQEPLSNDLQKLDCYVSTQIYTLDYQSRTRRYGVTDDILKGIALIRHLDNISRCSSVVVPSDVPSQISDLHSFHLLFKYANKHVNGFFINTPATDYILDMADVMGQKLDSGLETISPLRFGKTSLDMAHKFVSRGHHLALGPMIMGGTTGPITIAGTLALAVAEVLGSLFVGTAFSGEIPGFHIYDKKVIFSHGSHTNDPRTMLCSFGSPNQALIAMGTAQMARFYGIPSICNSNLTDALMPDFQCGFEKTFSALFSLLAGNQYTGAQGIAGADQGFSFEQLLLDNEWIDAYNYAIQGFEVSPETLAEEVIHEVGISGNFLAEEHTIEHLKENWWNSSIFKRINFDTWKQDGALDLLDRAHEMVEHLTTGYHNMDLAVTASIADELDRIMEDGTHKLGYA